MAKKADKKVPPITGVQNAPEVYVDGFQGAFVRNGTLKLNFFAEVFDPTQEKVMRKCVLVLTANAAVGAQIHEALGNIVSDLEEGGLITRVQVEETDA